jgi:manganese transport protein
VSKLFPIPETEPPLIASPVATQSATAGPIGLRELTSFLGPAFVASVAYIDPGNFAANIQGGSQFGYRLLWVLLWSNAMAILVQYLSAKLGIVTGLTLPQNCRKHFSRPVSFSLWVAAEVSAIATDLAEFLGAAMGLYLLFGAPMLARGFSRTETLLVAALISAVAVFVILALDLAGYRWLEGGIMAFVAIIGICYAVEVFLVHPAWRQVALHTLVPTLDGSSSKAFHASIYTAVAMLGATVMPHVVYLHSSLVLPRLKTMNKAPDGSARRQGPSFQDRARFLRFELVDVFIAMNGAWLINSAMIVVAALSLGGAGLVTPTIEDAYRTLGPMMGAGAATIFAVALLCSGLSSSTVGVLAGQVIIEGFLDIKFPIFVRRLITIVPALAVIAIGLDPLKILVLSQVILSFTLPFALMPLLILTNRPGVMGEFASRGKIRMAGWATVVVIVALNVVLLAQLALG